MTSTEALAYCQELGWLAKAMLSGWQGACGVLLICCVWFGCRYYFGVGIRMPRLRATAKRLAQERDAAKAENARLLGECAMLRGKMETLGLEAQKEINAADAKAARERAIRKRTEERLTEQNALLADANDRATSLEQLLLAVNDQQQRPAPGSAESWVPLAVVGGTEAGGLSAK
jgi:hypothetical protein